jgi:phosphoribosyl 1,2-cyclic phosphate phosphodiesterase
MSSEPNCEVVILGCGTSTGVPLLVYDCVVCSSKNQKNHRTRASIGLRFGKEWILIDTSTDFRFQALRERIRNVSAVFYTHPHADHVSGIDELRSYCYAQKARIPVYGNTWTRDDFYRRFSYIFDPGPVEGGGIPQLDFHTIKDEDEIIELPGGVRFELIRVPHGSKPVLGFRWNRLAYVTDCHEIPKTTLAKLHGLDVLIIDALRFQKHPTHLHLELTLDYIRQLAPKRAILTHMGHDFDYDTPPPLPAGVELGYDGLRIQVDL